MTSVLSSHPCNWSPLQVLGSSTTGKIFKVLSLEYSGLSFSSGGALNVQRESLSTCHGRGRNSQPMLLKALMNDHLDPGDGEDDDQDEEPSSSENGGINNELFRKDLERIVGNDDSNFTGVDLATLIRNKYGRSYDVQLIKKEFLGRNLLAMNVMWKYMEQNHVFFNALSELSTNRHLPSNISVLRGHQQRSFPLTEEEYLLRLDDVANTLKCWGAVSHIRNSLAKLKERPRIGKAVSIFIDMDETGGRANEWIYK